MKPRRAIKIDRLGDPLVGFGMHIDFAALAAEVDRVALRPVSAQSGQPPLPTETMVRILVLKRLHNLSDEQTEYQLLDRMSYSCFCSLADAANIPDRTTVWSFENQIGEAGAKALFDGVSQQLSSQGYIARGGQIIDAKLIPAPKQHLCKGDKEQIKEGAMPADWKPVMRRQKDLDATWTKTHGKSHHGYKLSINVDKRYKIIRKFKTNTAFTHDGQHFYALLDPANACRDVFADKGSPSGEREAKLKAAGYRNHIKRKGARHHPLSECRERRNQRIPKTRGPRGTCIRWDRPDGWQTDPHHRSGAGELCHDRDGDLLYNLKPRPT